MNDDNLWICFPFSKLKTSRADSDRQGSIIMIHGETYSLGGRITKLLKIPAIDGHNPDKYFGEDCSAVRKVLIELKIMS